jgi:metal-responsive CopG/Arc/MetJ family transcriptional regulator
MDEREPREAADRQHDEDDSQGIRPSAMQTVSARLPAVLVEKLNEEAARQGVRPSELIRQAVEILLRSEPEMAADLNVSVGHQMTIVTPLSQYQTANSNLVVEVPTEPSQVVAVGYL